MRYEKENCINGRHLETFNSSVLNFIRFLVARGLGYINYKKTTNFNSARFASHI